MKDQNKQLRNLTESVNKLYEQVGFGQADPSMPQIIPGNFAASRGRPAPNQYVGISAMYGDESHGHWRWDISPKYQEMWDTYIDAGGAWQKEVDMPWPPTMIDLNGDSVMGELPEEGDWWEIRNRSNEQFWFWVSYFNWFIGDIIGGESPNYVWRPSLDTTSPFYQIWLQSGQEEISDMMLLHLGELARGASGIIGFYMTGMSPNGTPYNPGSTMAMLVELMWTILGGGQWGDGVTD